MVLFTDFAAEFQNWRVGAPKKAGDLQISHFNSPNGGQFELDMHGRDGQAHPMEIIFPGECDYDETKRDIFLTPGPSDLEVHEKRLEAIAAIEQKAIDYAYEHREEIFGPGAARYDQSEIEDMMARLIMPQQDGQPLPSFKAKFPFKGNTTYRTKTQPTVDENLDTLRGKVPRMIGYLKLAACIWYRKERFGVSLKVTYLFEKSRMDTRALPSDFTRIKTRVASPIDSANGCAIDTEVCDASDTKPPMDVSAPMDVSTPMDVSANKADGDVDMKRPYAEVAEPVEPSNDTKRPRHDSDEEP